MTVQTSSQHLVRTQDDDERMSLLRQENELLSDQNQVLEAEVQRLQQDAEAASAKHMTAVREAANAAATLARKEASARELTDACVPLSVGFVSCATECMQHACKVNLALSSGYSVNKAVRGAHVARCELHVCSTMQASEAAW